MHRRLFGVLRGLLHCIYGVILEALEGFTGKSLQASGACVHAAPISPRLFCPGLNFGEAVVGFWPKSCVFIYV